MEKDLSCFGKMKRKKAKKCGHKKLKDLVSLKTKIIETLLKYGYFELEWTPLYKIKKLFILLVCLLSYFLTEILKTMYTHCFI